jgi:hypothetical protein
MYTGYYEERTASGARMFLRTGEVRITQIDKELRIPPPYATSDPRLGLTITTHTLYFVGMNLFGVPLYGIYSIVLPNNPLTSIRQNPAVKEEAWRYMQELLMGEVVWPLAQK